VSRYYSNNERRIQSLFELARDRQPCIVFIDDIDALCGQRTDGESESHRRIKTEFLIRIEGTFWTRQNK
jgi:vacuolar protein-sorting-associated protein 4